MYLTPWGLLILRHLNAVVALTPPPAQFVFFFVATSILLSCLLEKNQLSKK